MQNKWRSVPTRWVLLLLLVWSSDVSEDGCPWEIDRSTKKVNSPALVGLQHLLALADGHDLVAVVVLASPVVKERREKVRERLGVGRAKALEVRDAIVVLARPPT
jgi:hypothetical protein